MCHIVKRKYGWLLIFATALATFAFMSLQQLNAVNIYSTNTISSIWNPLIRFEPIDIFDLKKILEIKGKQIYGLEKLYTIFEFKYRMKSVGITSLAASDAGVITSIFNFPQLIPKRAKGKMSKKAKRMSRAIRKVLRQIENICEIFCPFLLKVISVR